MFTVLLHQLLRKLLLTSVTFDHTQITTTRLRFLIASHYPNEKVTLINQVILSNPLQMSTSESNLRTIDRNSKAPDSSCRQLSIDILFSQFRSTTFAAALYRLPSVCSYEYSAGSLLPSSHLRQGFNKMPANASGGSIIERPETGKVRTGCCVLGPGPRKLLSMIITLYLYRYGCSIDRCHQPDKVSNDVGCDLIYSSHKFVFFLAYLSNTWN